MPWSSRTFPRCILSTQNNPSAFSYLNRLMATSFRKGQLRKRSSKIDPCTPRAKMKRLKATLLQLCLRKDEERKPKPKAAIRVKSWKTEKEEWVRTAQNGC